MSGALFPGILGLFNVFKPSLVFLYSCQCSVIALSDGSPRSFHPINSSVSNRFQPFDHIVENSLIAPNHAVVHRTWLLLFAMACAATSVSEANLSTKPSLDQLRPFLSGRPLARFESCRRLDSRMSTHHAGKRNNCFCSTRERP
jgi:hypothetical protein